jgi:hypothetical protein
VFSRLSYSSASGVKNEQTKCEKWRHRPAVGFGQADYFPLELFFSWQYFSVERLKAGSLKMNTALDS